MKKITCFSLIVMFVALVGLKPIKADDVLVTTPFPYDSGLTQEEIDESNNIGVFLNYLMQGGTIDYSNSSNNYSADDLLNDFEDFFDNLTDGFVDVTKKALGIKDEFKYLYPLNSPWAQHGADILISLLPSIDDDNNTPTPSPDINYLSYLETINGNGFFWKNYSSTSINYFTFTATRYPFYEYSWIGVNQSTNSLNTVNILDLSGNGITFECLPITIHINGEGNNYFLQGSVTPYNNSIYWNYSGQNYYYNGFQFFSNVTQRQWDANAWNMQNTYNYSYSGTLEGCLQFVAQRFRNINLYVNGVLWSQPLPEDNSYSINITNGTVEPITNSPVHWYYEDEIYTDIEDIKNRLQDLIDRPDPTPITFPDFEDLIVDVNGQRAFAVTIIQDDTNIDEQYFDNYGPLIPIFIPLFTPVIDDVDIVNIASTPMEAIPSDLLEVFGYLFIGGLFVCFIHRLLE